MTRMPRKPYELVVAQDFVQQVREELGNRHPAAQRLEYDIQLTKANIPLHLRELVEEDWIWYLSYPFHVLTRLAKSDEIHPVCWIRHDQILRIRVATSDIFGHLPEQMSREFAAIEGSWKKSYGRMIQAGSLRLDPPPDLGEYWFGMLVWRTADERERQRMYTPVWPEYAWTPLYRYQEIFRIATILANEVTAASPFGDRPIREIRDEVSRLRAKYGIRLSKLPRTYRGSKTADLRQHRREMLRRLRDAGYSIVRVINEFGNWTSLASEIQQMDVCIESQSNDASSIRCMTREIHKPDLVVEMVQRLLDQYTAEEVDAGIFARDERTLRRDWDSLDG